MKSATQAASNWSGASGRAQTGWVAGIQGTQKDQAQLAAAAQPRYLQGVQDAVANNRFANGVLRRGTAYWKTQSEAKAGNYATGYTAGAGNFASAITKILQQEASIVAGLQARGDINANLQRANQFALAMHQAKGTLGAT